MSHRFRMPESRQSAFAAAALVLGAVLAMCGCGAPDAEFRRYDTYRLLQETSIGTPLTEDQRKNVDEVLEGVFGTPDNPLVPDFTETDVTKVLDLSKLQLAAGRVGSDQTGRPTGLYREHCAHCHGITGDGWGPTAAFLNPYPRDYRPAKFKFKSTPIGARPTHEDLKKIVLDGIPGTAMPSFALLPEQEVESLVHYVKYLSIRGMVERKLYETLGQLNENERIYDTAPRDDAGKAAQAAQLTLVKGLVQEELDAWIGANDAVVEIAPRPELTVAKLFEEEGETTPLKKLREAVAKKYQVGTPEELEQALFKSLKLEGKPAKEQQEAIHGELLAESQVIGRKLFYGSLANCFTCHGPTALGDGQLTDIDGWTKEFAKGSQPKLDEFEEYVALGLPPPRNIRPRNLRQGVFRGGMRPIDLYWRIKNGIEGTPMPANDKLTPEEIWHLVHYVQSLPYESISDPYQQQHQPANQRERM